MKIQPAVKSTVPRAWKQQHSLLLGGRENSYSSFTEKREAKLQLEIILIISLCSYIIPGAAQGRNCDSPRSGEQNLLLSHTGIRAISLLLVSVFTCMVAGLFFPQCCRKQTAQLHTWGMLPNLLPATSKPQSYSTTVHLDQAQYKHDREER